eukprot:5144602-Prymnesium_polylepis.4
MYLENVSCVSAGPFGNTIHMEQVAHVLARVAYRELVGPLVTIPDAISQALSTALKQRGGSRKRPANAATGTNGADRVDGAASLMIESCAARRTQLVTRKHDLFVWLTEIQKV